MIDADGVLPLRVAWERDWRTTADARQAAAHSMHSADRTVAMRGLLVPGPEASTSVWHGRCWQHVMPIVLISCGLEGVRSLEIPAALARAGWVGKIALIAPGHCTRVRLDDVCGLLLSDGNLTDDRRDALEFPLVAWASAEGVPILAVGRGAHVVRAARGGTPAPGTSSIESDCCTGSSGVRHVRIAAESPACLWIGSERRDPPSPRAQLQAFVRAAIDHAMHGTEQAALSAVLRS